MWSDFMKKMLVQDIAQTGVERDYNRRLGLLNLKKELNKIIRKLQ